MQRQPTTKAWHVLDENKSKYFLVDVVGQASKSGKTAVQVGSQKYEVPNEELLQHDPQKASSLFRLRFTSAPEILDWLRLNGSQEGFVKINPRVVLDLDKYSQQKRLEHISYLLGRFMVSLKKVQYICVANEAITEGKSPTVHQTIIKAIQSKAALWPYAVSLGTLNKLYSSFFSGSAIKFKIFVKDTQIIKLEILPYMLSSKDLFGSASDSPDKILSFNSRIFQILSGSPQQMKRYFRIPESSKNTKQPFNVNSLVDCFLCLGLQLAEITKIISLFSVIMNINELKFVRVKKQGIKYYKIKQFSSSRQNLEHLIGAEVLESLERELNGFREEEETTLQNIALKQEVLMKMIWKESILFVAEAMNQKLVNLKTTFTPQVRKLILIEFPATGMAFQQTPENYFLTKINAFIKEVALKLPLTHQASDIDFESTESVHKQLMQTHRYDFNKKILQDLEKEIKYSTQLKNGKFINLFITKILKNRCLTERKSKLGNVLAEIDELQVQQENTYANFILRSSLEGSSLPSKAMLQCLKKSIDEKHRKERQTTQGKLLTEFVDYENGKKNQQQKEDQEFIEVLPSTFEERYRYCEIAKEITRSKISVYDWLQNYFGKNRAIGMVKLVDEKEIVCLTEGLFNMLENERKVHELKINKIKAQIRRCRYRRQVIEGLNSFRIRMRLYRWLCSRVYPPIRVSMKNTRQRAALVMTNTALERYCLNIQRIYFHKLEKRAAVTKIGQLEDQMQPRSFRRIKQQFYLELKTIRKWQRRSQSFLLLFQLFRNNLSSHFFSKLKLNRKIQLKEEGTFKLVKQVNSKRVLNLREGFKQIAKRNISNYQSSEPQILINHQTVPSNNRNQPAAHMDLIEKIRKDSKLLNGSDLDLRSNAPSSLVGAEKSESVAPISQDQLYGLKDCPSFSFESWVKEATGFQKRKPDQSEKKAAVQKLFTKDQTKRPANKEPQQIIKVDILIKEKIVVNPFFPYIMQHLSAESQESLQKVMSHQYSGLKEPLLKNYKLKSFPDAPQEIFNNLLKIGKDKNTTKSKAQLINSIVKPIRDSYYCEKKKLTNVFEGEPALIIDYSWEHNIIKDEVFLQFIKQIMMNDHQASLRELFSTLEVITRYYYPSPQFIYAFLHYLKSLQTKNIIKFCQCFNNTLFFAQAYEKYKGNNVTILEEEVIPKEKESHNILELRATQISPQELPQYLTITYKLLNEERFQFRVRNQNLSFFKRKLLKDINFIEYEEYFGVYWAANKFSTMIMLNENMKAIDFLNQYVQNQQQNFCYVKLKQYFPFMLKDINKTKLMYLNSIVEERHLPWRRDDYEEVVALGMLFQQFQEYRIAHYLKITGQMNNKDVDISSVENKYQKMISNKGQGQKVNQFQYFKLVKSCGFIAAKGYRVKSSQTSPDVVSRVVIKPLELCLYEGTELKSSIHLRRVKSYFFEEGSIYLQIDYRGFQFNGMRSIILKGVQRSTELYQDILAYIDLLS